MIPIIFIPAGQFGNYKQHMCHVERIEYPTVLPTEHDTYGWERCDCGKFCMTWSPCIKIYTDVSDSIFARSKFYYIDEPCTFHNSSCPDGEDITIIQRELNNAQDIYLEYVNRTINCYYDDDVSYIFLEKYWNWDLTIGFLIFLGILTIIIIIINVCFQEKEELEPEIENTHINPIFEY